MNKVFSYSYVKNMMNSIEIHGKHKVRETASAECSWSEILWMVRFLL